jgi:hypothetical protein
MINVLQQENNRQESALFHQQILISHYASVLGQQHNVITSLQKQVDHQDSVIKRQEKALSMLRETVVMEGAAVLNPDVTEMDNLAQANLTDVTSLPHNTTTRADDGGPLEAVVSQMSQQLAAVTADIQVLKNSDTQQNLNIQDARTSTFVRWGSSHCPSNAELVYAGIVGGSNHGQTGGGTNYLCLTLSPVMSSLAVPHNHAVLLGSEYQTYDTAHNDMDPVCALCRSSHATTIMIPGTNICTSGWTKEYSGFLMAEENGAAGPSEYICVDESLESRPGSNANKGGRLLFYTAAGCGSLPCAPYVDNHIVTCVVCSK